VAAQWARTTAECIDIALAPARVLRVRHGLDRVELHDAVGVLNLQVHSAAGLDARR
jgi:hypothetical protein